MKKNKEGSFSNGRSSNKGGSNNSQASKIIVKTIDKAGLGSLQSSSILQSSVLQSDSRVSFNLSASDTGRFLDSKSQESKEEWCSNYGKVPKFILEDDLQKSGGTYNLSEESDNEETQKKPEVYNNPDRFSSNQLYNWNNDPFVLSPEDIDKTIAENNKILIQNDYMDLNQECDPSEQLNIIIKRTENNDKIKELHTEFWDEPLEKEIKRVNTSGIMDLENSPVIEQKNNLVTAVEINLHQENQKDIEIGKSLFDSQSKFMANKFPSIHKLSKIISHLDNSQENEGSIEYNNTDSLSPWSDDYQPESFRTDGYLFRKLGFMKD